MKKEYSKDDILKIFQSAPEAVRETLSSPELADLIFEIAKKNSLPSEKMVKIAQYNRNLLLGLTSPAEVLGNMIFAGISAEDARRILEELNQKVFIPTHKKMLDAKQETQNPKKSITDNDKKYVPEQQEPVHAPVPTHVEDTAINNTPDETPTEQPVHTLTKTQYQNPPPSAKKPPEQPVVHNHAPDPYRESL